MVSASAAASAGADLRCFRLSYRLIVNFSIQNGSRAPACVTRRFLLRSIRSTVVKTLLHVGHFLRRQVLLDDFCGREFTTDRLEAQ
jgi:hypothetical protein